MFDKVKKFWKDWFDKFGGSDYSDGYDEEDETETYGAKKPTGLSEVPHEESDTRSTAGAGTWRSPTTKKPTLAPVEVISPRGVVHISAPTSREDYTYLCDLIKTGEILAINFDKMEPELAQRVLDMLGGMAYALRCEMEELGNKQYIITPPGVTITADHRKDAARGSKGDFYKRAASR